MRRFVKELKNESVSARWRILMCGKDRITDQFDSELNAGLFGTIVNV